MNDGFPRFTAKTKDGRYGFIDHQGKTIIDPKWREVFYTQITYNNRKWTIYKCWPKKINTTESKIYFKINEWLEKIGQQAITSPDTIEYTEVHDEQGNRLWKSPPYSPLVFLVSITLLVIMLCFFGCWVINWRKLNVASKEHGHI